jgi:hypothetical protein
MQPTTEILQPIDWWSVGLALLFLLFLIGSFFFVQVLNRRIVRTLERIIGFFGRKSPKDGLPSL